MIHKKKPGSTAVLTTNPLEAAGFARYVHGLSTLFRQLEPPVPPLVILCIGSDRSTGDALGPLVGSMLTPLQRADAAVYGTLENPVHALNLEQVLVSIRAEHHRQAILAIDSSLGAKHHVGCLQLGLGSLRPGAAVQKKLPAVGDLFITGIVGVAGFMEYMVLQSTRLGLVLPLAQRLSLGLKQALAHARLPGDTVFYRDKENFSLDGPLCPRTETHPF